MPAKYLVSAGPRLILDRTFVGPGQVVEIGDDVFARLGTDALNRLSVTDAVADVVVGSATAQPSFDWSATALPIRAVDVTSAGSASGIRHPTSITVVDGVALMRPLKAGIVEQASSTVSGAYVVEAGRVEVAGAFTVSARLGLRGGDFDDQGTGVAFIAQQMAGATWHPPTDAFVGARLHDWPDAGPQHQLSMIYSTGGYADADVAVDGAADVPRGRKVDVVLHRAADDLTTVHVYAVGDGGALSLIGSLSGFSPTAPFRFLLRGLTNSDTALASLSARRLTGILLNESTMRVEVSNARRIAFLGDSTVLNSAVDLADRLEGELADLGDILMFGENGDRVTTFISEGRIEDVAAARPDVVCVQFGINDADFGHYVGTTAERQAQYRADLLQLVRQLRDRIRGVRVVLASGMYWDPSDPLRPVGNEDGANDKVAPFYAVSRSIADSEGLSYADVYTAMLAGAGGPSMLVDSIHPNALGVEYMASAYRAVL